MRLHQIKLEYVAEEDRLLLRLAADQDAEVLVWLTRRYVKHLWQTLLDMAQAVPEIMLQPNPEARCALLGFRHEAAISSANFAQRYEEDVRRAHPLGVVPLLVTRIQRRHDEGGNQVLGLFPAEGQGVHLTLDEGLLHGMVRLIENGVDKANWDLSLKLTRYLLPIIFEDDGRPTIN